MKRVLLSDKVKKGILLLPLLCILLLNLTACAVRTPVEQTAASEVIESLKYENVIFKKFTLASNARCNVPAPGPLAECMTRAMTYLTSKDVFNRVEEAGRELQIEVKNPYEEPTLIVDANLTFLRIVKGSARFFGGPSVGRSTMKMDVTLTDASTGSLLVRQEIVGAPSAFSSYYSFGSTDRTLPAKMGYLLGDFILANVSGK